MATVPPRIFRTEKGELRLMGRLVLGLLAVFLAWLILKSAALLGAFFMTKL